MKKIEPGVQPGTKAAPETFYIKITKDGPYLLYGNPPIDEEIITYNGDGYPWSYRRGKHYEVSGAEEGAPVALCRCGASKHKPFCDGSHHHTDWDPNETADRDPLLEDADIYQGPRLTMADNEKYCAFARFCDAYGKIWNLVQYANTDEEVEIVKHEAGHCPAGRLVVWDNDTEQVYEPPFEPSIGMIEDPGIKVAGPIWVKGGIRIESADGRSYEIRNRVTLCRCGQSANKPFCDGTHAEIRFKD